MSDSKKIEDLKNNLKQQRDELRVKLHLAGEEAKDIWDDLDAKYDNFSARAKQLGREAGDASKDIWEATGHLGEEIRKGYKRLRNML